MTVSAVSFSRPILRSGVITTKGALLLITALVTAGTAVSQSPESLERHAAWKARMEKLFAIEKRVQQTVPVRRERPSRVENITDNEVREIQAVTSEILPGPILNIGTVVVGCPCEDGQSCSDQVWVVAHRPGKTKGLLLSKISDRWSVGPVQRWWLEREDLEARRKSFASWESYMDAEDALTERFPACVAQGGASGDKRTPPGHP